MCCNVRWLSGWVVLIEVGLLPVVLVLVGKLRYWRDALPLHDLDLPLAEHFLHERHPFGGSCKVVFDGSVLESDEVVLGIIRGDSEVLEKQSAFRRM